MQGQIINLMKDLQNIFGLTYLFIAHDLSMVKYISDRVGVMYLGRLVELAEKKELFENPKHPYTQALLSCIPIPNPRIERERIEIPIDGEIPSPVDKIAGCSFKTRCPYAVAACDEMAHKLIDTGNAHFVMCKICKITFQNSIKTNGKLIWQPVILRFQGALCPSL